MPRRISEEIWEWHLNFFKEWKIKKIWFHDSLEDIFEINKSSI